MAAHVFIHIGDAHVQHGHPRNADRLASIDQIIARGLETPSLAAWLWPGDLFHAKSTPQDRIDIATRLQKMASVAPVLICQGNHDQPGDLDIFERLDAEYPIVVFTSPKVTRTLTATNAPLACFGLPYPHKAGLVAAGVEHESLGTEAANALDAIFISAAAQLAEIRASGGGEVTLMIGHVNVGGAIASIGQPQIGKEIELHPSHLARLGPIPIALNHIHAHQQIHGAVYAGSTSRHDYGEMEAKGYVEWTFDDHDDDIEEAPAWSWRFVSIDTPAQYHVEGRLSRERFDYIVTTGPDGGPAEMPASWAGADVRVRYRYVKSEIGALDVAKIHAEFAGCRSLKLDGVPELEHQVRAPEIAAALTLEDKTKAYAARHGIAWTPAMDAKLAALLAHDEQALVASVAQTLALMANPPELRLAPESAVA